MRIDVDTCRDPELLAGEVRRLRAAISSEQTLTDEEREAVAWFANYGYSPDGVPGRMAATLRGLLERLGGCVRRIDQSTAADGAANVADFLVPENLQSRDNKPDMHTKPAEGSVQDSVT